MLVELAVRNLGVIERASLILGPGMTALTGETGAGKTMIVQAVQLLVGGRADPSMVRTGADAAVVEGRFVVCDAMADTLHADGASSLSEPSDGYELVLRREIPAAGRSRAYVGGAMASPSQLAQLGAGLIDLHGQHQHQSLLSSRTQREALDRWGRIDLRPLRAAREQLVALQRNLAALGGDARARAQEIDVLRFQVEEISEAQLDDPDELLRLAEREDLLADAAAHLAEGHSAHHSLAGDDGVIDKLGEAEVALASRKPFAAVGVRLGALAAELDDTVEQLRGVLESIDEDPRALAEVRARHQRLRELTRKYGDTLAEVLAFGADAAQRLCELERHDELAGELETGIVAAQEHVACEADAVARTRSAAAPGLAAAVTGHLGSLALEHGRLDVDVSGPAPSDNVEFRFSASRGTGTGALSKVASGGELARVMLALRLVLTAGPPTLVFDEVDAGIGGEAALAVGRALSSLAPAHQVLVVTHLPQVAAFAHHQVTVRKTDDGATVASDVVAVTGGERISELARMLSGQPDLASGRQHATELLASAASLRPRTDSPNGATAGDSGVASPSQASPVAAP